MNPAVKKLKNRISQEKKLAKANNSNTFLVQLTEGLEAIVRANNAQVCCDTLRSNLLDIFSTSEPEIGKIIHLSSVCDFDYDLLLEDSIEIIKDNRKIQEKILSLV